MVLVSFPILLAELLGQKVTAFVSSFFLEEGHFRCNISVFFGVLINGVL
jgi:hypothetical protein